jgi:hypothetical protein
MAARESSMTSGAFDHATWCGISLGWQITAQWLGLERRASGP